MNGLFSHDEGQSSYKRLLVLFTDETYLSYHNHNSSIPHNYSVENLHLSMLVSNDISGVRDLSSGPRRHDRYDWTRSSQLYQTLHLKEYSSINDIANIARDQTSQRETFIKLDQRQEIEDWENRVFELLKITDSDNSYG